MLCDEELNHCEKNPDTCQNGAKCISLIKSEGSYKCLCREGTRGRNCEISTLATTTTKWTTLNETIFDFTTELPVTPVTVTVTVATVNSTSAVPPIEKDETKESDNETEI